MSKFVDIEPEYRRSTKPKEIITISTNAIDFKNNVYEIVINKYINKTILAGPFIKNNKIKPKINNTLNTKTI